MPTRPMRADECPFAFGSSPFADLRQAQSSELARNVRSFLSRRRSMARQMTAAKSPLELELEYA
jgi:hypothetical protein